MLASYKSSKHKMAGTIETQYKELLNPIKDPEQSFAINIAELLQSYVKGFADGKIPPNFNSAALLLQGSCSIYGKRVEYLHNLATKLYQLLIKKKNDGTKKDKDGKEKVVKENKFSDPFFSTEIRLGKNLSCLRKKASSKNAKKGAKKASDKKFTFVPVDLLPLEGEEKGDVFYDTRGEPVGNKGDYTLNKCRVTKSGWLLLPTVSPELVETDQLLPDYTIEEGQMDDDDTCHDSDMPVSTPADEGYPPSTGCSNTPGSEDPCSQNPGCEDPLSQGTDEGLGSLPCTPQENESQAETATDTPMEVPSGQLSGENTPSNDSTPDTPMEGMEDNGIENIPIDDADVAPKPRRSMRQALKVCQVKESESPTEQEKKVLQEEAREEVVAIKRAIQKKNTYKIPSKLKEKDKITNIFPASEFCARTFFSLDQKFKKNCILSLGVPAFEKNSALFKRFVRIAEVLKATNREKKKRKKNNEDDDVGEIDVEEMENILEPDNDIEAPHLDLGDIVIENSASPKMIVDNENPMADEEEP
ncbi:condensin-2 complex subunit H2 [Trichonephila clavata]|uniref:Condensin-2 complex subunit H2 n=1 Tax=Trichonephila clavata TaxID=2740835 RepID=A0A8X6F712_TRICU|nr:condensin-2 complex subunit H2 [Trichonephila clavata]